MCFDFSLKTHSSCHYIGTGAQVYFTFWRQIPTVVCIGVLYLSGDGWYVCRDGGQSTSEPKVQDRPKPSRGSALGKTRPGTPRRNRVVETPYCWRLTKYHLKNRGVGNRTTRYRRLRYRIPHRLKNRGTPKPYHFLRFSNALLRRALKISPRLEQSCR